MKTVKNTQFESISFVVYLIVAVTTSQMTLSYTKSWSLVFINILVLAVSYSLILRIADVESVGGGV